MKRREFVRFGLIGSAAAMAGPATAAGRSRGAPRDTGPPPTLAQADFELEEATIADLQDGMGSGSLTARSIVEMYIERIDQLDDRTVNSVLEINPDALAIADELDAERRAGQTRGPMHGIPVLLKANIDTADKMQTTAGSLALAGSIATRDSFVAQKLREAGALILGKTNLSEWANFRSTRSTSGWSAIGGQTHNPYALDRNPCGSSSGSGAAPSANFCSVAIGTETDGSVVCPANANSLVGIKPTIGLVSRSGIIPIAHSQDTAGPMTRTVADGAILLGALTGVDSRDPSTASSRGRSVTDYTQFLDPDGLRGARIGVGRNFFGFHDRVDALMEEAIEVMRRQGAEIIDPANMETAGEFGEAEFEILLYEFRADLNQYLSGLPEGAVARSLREIIEFNEQHRDTEMPYFGQEIFHMAEEKGPLTEQAYLDALATAHRLARAEGIDAVMNEHDIDAIVAPTDGPPWTTDLINGDHFLGSSSSPAAVSGYPDITVPLGYIYGLPAGISFFGRAFSEPTLIKIAYAFEQAAKARRPPRFLPTADLSPASDRAAVLQGSESSRGSHPLAISGLIGERIAEDRRFRPAL